MTLTLNTLKTFFEFFGVAVFSYVTLRVLLRVLNNIGTFFLGFGSVNLRKYGSWGVVTGCTDGIGKAYVEQIAKRGLNVVLISRSLDKLQEQAREISEKYSVAAKVIAADFTGNLIFQLTFIFLIDTSSLIFF
jgi:17beta-estradiol 17-dehydrogenase / very-long-chain 3-oxoacyl-CoA reductase